MTTEQLNNEKMYLMTMAIFRKFLQNGLISDEEYAIIDTIMTEKYGSIFGDL